jgi:hypothetical protein
MIVISMDLLDVIDENRFNEDKYYRDNIAFTGNLMSACYYVINI